MQDLQTPASRSGCVRSLPCVTVSLCFRVNLSPLAHSDCTVSSETSKAAGRAEVETMPPAGAQHLTILGPSCWQCHLESPVLPLSSLPPGTFLLTCHLPPSQSLQQQPLNACALLSSVLVQLQLPKPQAALTAELQTLFLIFHAYVPS